jgi:hypothetical protein
MPLGAYRNLTLGRKRFPLATGGDVVYETQDLNDGFFYRYHEFKTTGTTANFEVQIGGEMDILVVGGGGSGVVTRAPWWSPAGGGAGAMVEYSTDINSGTYTILVGSGGSSISGNTNSRLTGLKGATSSFENNEYSLLIQASGGGGGGMESFNGGVGGCGGGAGYNSSPGAAGSYAGTGTQYAYAGGNGFVGVGGNRAGGGGGGAGGTGGAGSSGAAGIPGNGGIGRAWLNNRYFCGGGGAGGSNNFGTGGKGGGGNGSSNTNAQSGANNSGGGGGGAGSDNTTVINSGAGGSGIVIIRYRTKPFPQIPIVTSGLVLNLDAGNPASYPGSGTTWNDISGNSNNVTLTNGPTFDSANNGSIVFDGVDDHANFFAPNLGNTTTVEMWVKLGASYSGNMFFGWLRYDVWCGGGDLAFNSAASDRYGISSATVSSLGLVGNWNHYIFEMRSDVSYTNNKIYINGVSQTLSQQAGTENAGNRTFNSGNGRIAGWLQDNLYRMPMNCSVFRVYNRALSQSEVQQNFTALRGRYGI